MPVLREQTTPRGLVVGDHGALDRVPWGSQFSEGMFRSTESGHSVIYLHAANLADAIPDVVLASIEVDQEAADGPGVVPSTPLVPDRLGSLPSVSNPASSGMPVPIATSGPAAGGPATGGAATGGPAGNAPAGGSPVPGGPSVPVSPERGPSSAPQPPAQPTPVETPPSAVPVEPVPVIPVPTDPSSEPSEDPSVEPSVDGASPPSLPLEEPSGT